MKTKYGKSYIGHLEAENSEKYRVWLPPKLADELQSRKLPVFVRPEGLK